MSASRVYKVEDVTSSVYEVSTKFVDELCCGPGAGESPADERHVRQPPSSPSKKGRSSQEGVFDDDDYLMQKVMRGNAKFVRDMEAKDPNFFKKLGVTHKPDIFYIGCSDARVPANAIIGMPAGQVFVHRNIANCVVATDMNMLACLHYAVTVLKVKHIFVTGHYECGGIMAAMQNKALGPIDYWLTNIRNVYRLHQEELDNIKDEKACARRLVELNVVEQCLNLYKTEIIQKRRFDTFTNPMEPFTYPRIHPMVFDPKIGRLEKVPFAFAPLIAKYSNIYDLYELDEDESKEDSMKGGEHFMIDKKPSKTL